jgi:lipid-binding SYLF domain-containing protein
MNTRHILYTLAILFGFTASTCLAAPPPRATTDNAIAVLESLAKTPEKSIPPSMLRDSAAVIIAPDVIKGSFVIGARHGHGVLLMHEKDGSWSNPVFVTVTGGSVGLQVGLESTDLFLVVRNARSLERIVRGGGKLTLGADASIAAGPFGREAAAATDAQLKAEILTYSRSRGVFAGVSLDGSTLLVDREANARYYSRSGVKVGEILGNVSITIPESAVNLRTKLSRMTEGNIMVEPPVILGPVVPAMK